MKKLIALIAVVGFITVKSASAQTAAQNNDVKATTEMKAESTESKKEMKSCHGTEAKSKSSCCKSKSKASCCSKHGEEKAEATEKEKEKVKGAKD